MDRLRVVPSPGCSCNGCALPADASRWITLDGWGGVGGGGDGRGQQHQCVAGDVAEVLRLGAGGWHTLLGDLAPSDV